MILIMLSRKGSAPKTCRLLSENRKVSTHGPPLLSATRQDLPSFVARAACLIWATESSRRAAQVLRACCTNAVDAQVAAT